MNPLVRSWLLFGLAATVFAAADLALDPRARALVISGRLPDEITLQEARTYRGPLLWIDARSEAEFARDHIPAARSLDPARWDTAVTEILRTWQPGTRLIVYCREAGCGTSRNVADRLRQEYQLPDVWVLRGGWEAWQKAAGR